MQPSIFEDSKGEAQSSKVVQDVIMEEGCKDQSAKVVTTDNTSVLQTEQDPIYINLASLEIELHAAPSSVARALFDIYSH